MNPLLETCRRITEELALEKDPHRQEELANVVMYDLFPMFFFTLTVFNSLIDLPL